MRITIIAGLMLLLVEYCPVFCQSNYEIPIADSLSPIDIFKDDDGFLNIIEKHGLYQLNGNDLELIVRFDNAIQSNKNFHCLSGNPIFSTSKSGFVELDDRSQPINHSIPTDRSILSKSNKENYDLFADHIYSINSKTCYNTVPYEFKYDPLVIPYNEKYLIFDQSDILLSYDPDVGLDTVFRSQNLHDVNFATIQGDSMFYSSCNSLFACSLKKDSLEELYSVSIDAPNCIIDMVQMNDELVLITAQEIFSVNKRTHSASKRPSYNEEFEEFLALQKHGSQAYWILTDRYLKLKTNLEIDQFESEAMPIATSSHYTIRSKEYISDGNKVFRKSAIDQAWEFDPSKAAPIKVLTPKDGHPVLIFPTHLIRIHKENALILDWLELDGSISYTDVYVDNTEFLIASDQGLFRPVNNTLERIEGFNRSVSGIYRSEQGLYVLTDDSVFKYDNTSFQWIRELDRSSLKNIVSNDLLISLNTSSQISISDLLTGEEQMMNNASMQVLDLGLTEDQLVLLTPGSILYYDLGSLDDSKPRASLLIPFQSKAGKPKIITANSSHIFIRDDKMVYDIKKPQTGYMEEPRIKLELMEDKSIHVVHTNPFSENIKFNYLFSGDDKNEAVWTSDPHYADNYTKGEYNSLVVSMSDDLTGKSFVSNPFKLPGKPKSINYLFYLIMLLLIFATAFSGLRLLKLD